MAAVSMSTAIAPVERASATFGCDGLDRFSGAGENRRRCRRSAGRARAGPRRTLLTEDEVADRERGIEAARKTRGDHKARLVMGKHLRRSRARLPQARRRHAQSTRRALRPFLSKSACRFPPWPGSLCRNSGFPREGQTSLRSCGRGRCLGGALLVFANLAVTADPGVPFGGTRAAFLQKGWSAKIRLAMFQHPFGVSPYEFRQSPSRLPSLRCLFAAIAAASARVRAGPRAGPTASARFPGARAREGRASTSKNIRRR